MHIRLDGVTVSGTCASFKLTHSCGVGLLHEWRAKDYAAPNTDWSGLAVIPADVRELLLSNYRLVDGAAGAVVAGPTGAAGVTGRVEVPTVVPGAELLATFGPLQGAHIKTSARTAMPAITAIIMLLRPLSRRFRSSFRIFISSVAAREMNCDKSGKFPPLPDTIGHVSARLWTSAVVEVSQLFGAV